MTTGSASSPALSVIFTADRYETIRRTIASLRAQTVRSQLEVVIVTPSRAACAPNEDELAWFAGSQVIETRPLGSLRGPKAEGIFAASAPLIALAESHCFPEPRWAEALIEAHRGPWAAIGPAIGNANPRSLISWSNLLIDYGPWLAPHPGGPVEDLPANNTSYKRDVLIAYGDRLGALLDAATVLHADMRENGHRLRLEGKAVALHLNVSRASSWLPERFYAARVYANARAQRWSKLRRTTYVGGAALIPIVRFLRILSDLRRANLERKLVPRVVPALSIGLLASAAGEVVGYLFGPGRSVDRLAEYELHRERYLSRQERSELVPAY